MKPLRDCRLYGFIDTGYTAGRAPELLARELCLGGADIVQLRAKDLTAAEIERIANRILPITSAAGVPLVINDHLAVAVASQASLLHLGQEDFFDAGHRHVSELLPAGSPLRIGLSTHAPDQANRALLAGAHYIAIGPVFPTGTKPTARPVTLEYVRWAEVNIQIPWFAIGGITLDNLGSVLDAGARRICVVSAILNARDVAAACAAFKTRVLAYPVEAY